MNRLPLHSTITRSLLMPMVALAAFTGGARRVEASLTLDMSSGSIVYSVYNTGTASGSGTFNSGGMLTYPGGGLPALTTQVGGSSQTATASTLSPFFLSSAISTPANFGSATTEVYVATSGQQGSFTTQGGIYFSNRTNLADNLTEGSNTASVSFTTAVATYTNNEVNAQGHGISVTIDPGAVMSVAGTLGSSDSYVAAGLTSSFTLFGAGVQTTTTAIAPIILASGGGVNIATTGGGPNDFASVTVKGSSVTGTGTSLDLNSVTLLFGESITITSYLTLISDPGSSIGIADEIPDDVSVLPDFGTFASSPSVAVPEPSTIALLGSGLAMAACWGRSSRRRRSTKA
jgi:PEP-CTERM motif